MGETIDMYDPTMGETVDKYDLTMGETVETHDPTTGETVDTSIGNGKTQDMIQIWGQFHFVDPKNQFQFQFCLAKINSKLSIPIPTVLFVLEIMCCAQSYLI